MIKKIISFLLLSSIAISGLASCSGKTDTDSSYSHEISETTAAAEAEETTILKDKVPELNFDGYEFRFLTSATTSTYCITAVNEANGEILNDAMYERTRNISERFNMKFAEDVVAADSTAAFNQLTNMVKAGDDAYDASMQLGRSAFAKTSEGLFLDMNTLPYLDMKADWWFTDINELVNLTDRTYIAFSSLTFGIYDFINVLLFNKNMVEDRHFDNPYDLVDSGTWTFDKFAVMAKEVAADIDGDGNMTESDVYGIAGRSNSLLGNFLAGACQRSVEIDDDGVPYLAISEKERIFTIFEEVSSLIWDDGIWYSKTSTENNYYVQYPFFENGQALFADRSFNSVTKLRDMEDDFGVIPFPKFDEEQEKYGVMVEAGGRALVIPTTAKATEVIGAAIEALSFYSYVNVVPAYYEVCLKQKYTRDDVSARMFDLVLDSIFYDMGNTMFCSSVKDGVFAIFRSGKRNLASSVASNQNAFNNAVKAAMEIVD